MNRPTRHVGLVATAAVAAGCGGGMPLMHPAHPLVPDQVSMGAGVSHTLALGEADEQIQAARRAAEPAGTSQGPDAKTRVLTGALAYASSAPGLAPWVGARAGLGWDSDAGVTYSGRSARVDARHAFVDESLALSVGAGARGLLSRPGSDGGGSRNEPISGVDTGGLTGFGFDVPLTVGYRSAADLLQAYGGLRGDFERVFGDVRLRNADPSLDESVEVSVSRVGGSALVGLVVGVPPFWIVLEGSVGVIHGRGSFEVREQTGSTERVSARFTAPTVSPAGALVTRF